MPTGRLRSLLKRPLIKGAKKILLSGILLLTAVKVYGATYLLPPDIDDLRQSVKSPTVKVISHTLRDTTYPFTILLNRKNVVVRFDCVQLPKITCVMGTWKVYVSVVNFSAYEKDTVTSSLHTTTITGIDLRVVDQGNTFLVCGMMASKGGNALLTDHDTPDAAGNPGQTYDPTNPSFLTINVKQVCQ